MKETLGSPAMHVIRKLLELTFGNNVPSKYEYPRNQAVVVYIGGIITLNKLINLRATVNIITNESVELLWLTNMRLAPTI